MTDEERAGQIEWLEDLKEAIESGKTEIAIKSIEGAIKMLEREGEAVIQSDI